MIQEVFNVSRAVKPRSKYEVLATLMEEVGELSTEVAIDEGYSLKKSEEGILGEGADVIICVLDLIWLDSENVTDDKIEEMLMETLKLKLAKWLNKKKK